MKRRHGLMGIALAASAWLAFFSDPGAEIDIVEPVTRAPHSTPAASIASSAKRMNTGTPSKGGELTILALQPRDNLIKRTVPDRNQSALFGSHDWTPPPPSPVIAAPSAPAAPPLPFKYLGKAKETDQWQVFLSKGDVTLMVKEEDVIDSLYRVQSITPPSMTLLYLPLSETQSLTIE
jgi:hypothetical protein